MANKSLVPAAKEALNKFKMEAASEVGVNLKQGYNGDLTAKQAGSVGGQMVKKTGRGCKEHSFFTASALFRIKNPINRRKMNNIPYPADNIKAQQAKIRK